MGDAETISHEGVRGNTHPVAGGVLAALGLASLGVTLVHFGHENEPTLGVLLGIVPPVIVSLVVVGAGGWILRSDLDRQDAGRVVAWTGGGGLVGGASAVMFVLYQQVHGVVLADVSYAISAAATGGMAAGLLVAGFDRRARRRRVAAEAASRVLETVRQVVQAASRAEDRETLEATVCQQFEDAGPYLFAWIGEVDAEAGTVAPRTVTETAAPYLDRVEIPLDPEGEPRGPTARAIASGDPQVVDDVRSDPTYGPWRDSARSAGVMSSIAVPLIAEDRAFGVLNVYAGRVGAFEGRERAILAELGETIAQALARLEYRDRLEAQNEQLDALNRLLRHDIRNDMNVIMAHAERLRVDEGEPDVDSVDLLLNKVDHVVELTETARDLSESMQRGAADREPVALDRTLARVLDTVRSTYPDAEFVLADEVPGIEVRADDMLASVFENLLNNAVQHHDRDEPRVEVTVAVDEETVAVAVADDGPGIPDAMKERVFEHGESGPESSGTGLGLYLVRTLVDQYGGEVTVEDNEPRGTVFRVRLVRAGGTNA